MKVIIRNKHRGETWDQLEDKLSDTIMRRQLRSCVQCDKKIDPKKQEKKFPNAIKYWWRKMFCDKKCHDEFMAPTMREIEKKKNSVDVKKKCLVCRKTFSLKDNEERYPDGIRNWWRSDMCSYACFRTSIGLKSKVLLKVGNKKGRRK